MSHASVLVAVPSGKDVKDAVEHEMAPYDEGGTWFRDGSRWDWWQIGGRYTGKLDGYDPAKDPANVEVCELCEGTGTRTMAVPMSPNWKPKEGECNGCSNQGEDIPVGHRVKWPTQWAEHKGDMMPIAIVRELKEPVCAAAFLRDRHWQEAGRLGWFGGDTLAENEDEKPSKDVMRFRHDDGSEALITTHKEPWEHWEAKFHERFVEDLAADMVLVVVDYHV